MKKYLEQFGGRSAERDVDAKTDTQEMLEILTELLRRFEGRSAICRDEVECFERFFVEVRRFILDHLDGHDAK